MCQKVTLNVSQFSKSLLRQMKLFPMPLDHLPATEALGWFYGDTLGKDYRRSPYVLCVEEGGTPYLTEPNAYRFDGTVLVVSGKRIPQLFVK